MTLEEAKAESVKRIRDWWEKGSYKTQKGIDHETFDFDAEFAKGLTSDEFKNEMNKRIGAYPWKK